MMTELSTIERAIAERLKASFEDTYGPGEWREFLYVQAPGRTEIAGNHTDHQGGSVIAAAVNRYVRGVVAANEDRVIRVMSERHSSSQVSCDELEVREDEFNTSVALVRGMAAQFAKRGFAVRGFDAYLTSDVATGSGLSSSAAFELELGQAMNVLWAKGVLSPEELALMAQAAEREWFGKPCGLMDQAAVALGGVQHMSFAKPGAIDATSIDFDFGDEGYALCLTAIGSSHADLTDEYAAVPAEMFQIAHALGAERLGATLEADFAQELPAIRDEYGDRAVLRAIHFYREERLVEQRAKAMGNHDMAAFLEATRASGASSAMFLQNVSVAGTGEQPAMVGIAVSEEMLAGRGATRIHGGGFGGTIQAFVPVEMADSYVMGMDHVFGEGACQVYQVDHEGARARRL